MNAATAPTTAPRDPFAWLCAHPLAPILALVCAQVLLRLVLSPALEMDEAEQIVWTQRLAWGYGVQPPLYTWLQWGVNALLGSGVLALSLLKHTLLALTYALLWHAARLQGLGARGAWLAAGSVLLFPLVCWMAVRDLTHSVLLLTCTAWLYLALVRLLAQPAPARFVMLGAALAAGMLAKYNFALIAAALLGAALLDAAQRRALFSRGWPLALLTAALLVAPHLLWLATHWGEIAARMSTKMATTGSGAGWPRLTALGQLAADLPAAVALWLAAMLACLGTGWLRPGAAPASAGARLLLRYVLLITLALLAVVLVATPARLTPRWLEPFFILLPMLAFLRRPELEQHPRAHWLAAAICTAALLGMLMVAARPAWHLHKGQPDELNTDPQALVRAALAVGYDGVQPIVVTRLVPGGNLHLAFPHAPVLQCPRKDCRETLDALEREGRGWLLVLDRHAERRQQPPERLAGLHARRLPPLPALMGALLPPASRANGTPGYLVWLKWQPPQDVKHSPEKEAN